MYDRACGGLAMPTLVDPHNDDDHDDLRAARGCMFAMPISLALWLVIIIIMKVLWLIC